jgi:flagellar hook-length control protein FliK
VNSRELRALQDSQLRIAWNSDELGRVDIHAQLRGRNVSAELRVENDGARQFLTTQVPHIGEALRGHDFTVGPLQVSSFASDSGPSHGSKQQQPHASSIRPELRVDREQERADDETSAAEVQPAITHTVSIHV